MRFRYKVIMINIAFLSMALGILGCFMIYRNFKQSMRIQTTYAIEENNIIQSSIEYRLLDAINQKKNDFSRDIYKAGRETSVQMLSGRTTLYILYDDSMVFNATLSEQNLSESEDADINLPTQLLESLDLGEKKYLTQKEASGYYIYVASKNIINEKYLYIITKQPADDTYQLLFSQIFYFLILMLVVLSICTVFLYIISTRLTQPMERLNDVTDLIANGDYTTLAEVNSDDEIGMLAEKFNYMACAVSAHIEELNAMVKQHEQFVADFTHEIKTPMTTIIGYADTLRSKQLTAERQQLAYQYIYHEGKRLETMSMKLFDLIYLKDNEIEKSEIETAVLANEVVDSMQPILERKDIRLHCDITPTTIFGEAELLKTVFINLIDNARKASQPGDSIAFRGYFHENTYLFEVADHGCGMDEETVRHICDEFYMADKSRTRAEGGAGLGMSLVSLIIQRHGAKLDIHSIPAEGTTMRVLFPIE